MTNRFFDVAVIGGGLAGSRVVVELLARLRGADSHVAWRLPEIVMVDRRGAFGGTLPRGSADERGLLRVEAAGPAVPKDFHDWLFSHRYALAERCKRPQQDLLLRAWILRNERRLLSGAYEDLYVPRRFFAEFAASALYEQAQRASEGGYARVEFLRGEVVTIEAGEEDGYDVALASGRHLTAHTVVRAGRTVPMPPPSADCPVVGATVQSVRAVYREAQDVADALYTRLVERLHGLPLPGRDVPSTRFIPF